MIPDAFKPFISHYERIGKYTNGKNRLDILIVHLSKETSIERARSMQRNFVAGYLQGNYGTTSQKDAALVAFVSPNGDDWRFSLVRMESRLEESPPGKMKVKDEYTPARRWSFLVGRHEKSHTAQSKLVPIMEDDDHNPTLVELEDAFNIEKVTKEFFEKYRSLFIWTKEELDHVIKSDQRTKADFESKGINTVDLAKKLLGQIIFLYFLQKKGWFGVPRNAEWGDGSKQFLRELFSKKHADYKNFFNDILEPLFYEALRNDRSYDDHYYSRFNCKIPFLNGGLFDPMNNYDWVYTDILIPNKLFSNTHKTKEGDIGDGILDIFDRYNFTVREDEPFEKEVAIDPELLGKAYEKFNAIRPDNFDEYQAALKSGQKGEENKFNKQYGVYYTPREIVHYMCQQNLINYLATELVGDGNPPINKTDIETLILHGESLRENEAHVDAAGRETETYSYKLPESVRKHAILLDDKLAAIKMCDPAVGSGAFPVGMMSEIVKARQTLATHTQTGKTTYQFKRACIENSLYGVDIDPGAVEIAKLRLWLSLVVDEDDIHHIKPLPNLDYKIVRGNSLVGVEKNLFNLQLFADLEILKPLYFNETNPFKKKETKNQIDSLIDQITRVRAQFDFEIYFSEVFHEGGGFDMVIGNPPYIQIKGIPVNERRFFEEKFKFATGRFNIFYLFIEKAQTLARKKGVVSFIIPDRLLLNTQCANLRKWLLNDNQILEIISFDEQVFDTAVVDSIILTFENCPREKDYIIAKVKTSPERIQNSSSIEIPCSYITLSPSAQFDLNYNLNKSHLLKKILSKSVLLETISETKDGIIQSKIGDHLFLKESKNIHCQKMLVGENINKYSISYDGRWVDYRPNAMMVLEKKRGGNGLRLRDRRIFERSKILTRQTADEIIAVYDEDNYYFYANTLHGTAILDKNYHPYYVLGVLNSKLTTWFYRSNTDEEGKTFAQIKIELLRRLPIPKIDFSTQSPIIQLVERILTVKRDDPVAETSTIEAEIDRMVYQLYGLTEEEISIV
ncbi:Eco57I restriction-modification methylase domain-containing protein, partial [Candidatus Bathyarchaeota archaeon]|nr:Eco57I restriction-modification methylase domain-containing protein [Candidatus Bathyarchaeota archaeon]